MYRGQFPEPGQLVGVRAVHRQVDAGHDAAHRRSERPQTRPEGLIHSLVAHVRSMIRAWWFRPAASPFFPFLPASAPVGLALPVSGQIVEVVAQSLEFAA